MVKKLKHKAALKKVDAHQRKYEKHHKAFMKRVKSHPGSYDKKGKLTKSASGLLSWGRKAWKWVKAKTRGTRKKIVSHAKTHGKKILAHGKKIAKQHGKKILAQGKAAASSTIDNFTKTAEAKIDKLVSGVATHVSNKIKQGSDKVNSHINKYGASKGGSGQFSAATAKYAFPRRKDYGFKLGHNNSLIRTEQI